MTVPPFPGQPGPGQPNPYGPPPSGQPAYGQQPPAGQPNPFATPSPAQPGAYGQQPLPLGQPGPYGQQPPPLGQPGPYGQPVPFGVPPKKKKPLALRIGLAVVLAVAVGLVAFSVLRTFGDAGWAAQQGDCLDVAEFSDNARDQPTQVDCGDAKATVKVAVVLDEENDSCPDGDYDEIFYENGKKFCLMLNVVEGDCVANVTSMTEGYEHVECSDPSAEIAVLKIVEGQTDIDTACGDTEAFAALRYTEPALVMCLTEPKTV
ncbi:hypothetical protein ABZ863_25120 [Saccharomonospora sp. NPDC046836]|uniref:LppU/SCO3897 family protein n=1 Tax=Saccharomonospora sp. NPDC046836 TaxID=3156921 RepID=UPI0033E09082